MGYSVNRFGRRDDMEIMQTFVKDDVNAMTSFCYVRCQFLLDGIRTDKIMTKSHHQMHHLNKERRISHLFRLPSIESSNHNSTYSVNTSICIFII